VFKGLFKKIRRTMVAIRQQTPLRLVPLEEADFQESFLSTGVPSLDHILKGGWSQGRIIEIFGTEGSGKTTLAIHAAIEAQKAGLEVAYIDTEHKLNAEYATQLGINSKTLLVSRPDSGEDALNLVWQLLKKGTGLIIVDSIATLATQSELDMEAGEYAYKQNQMLSEALKRFSTKMGKKSTLMLINQLREKEGATYGNPEEPTGGMAVGYAASTRVEVRRYATLKRGQVEYGVRVKATVKKSNTSNPHQAAEFDLVFGKGVNYWENLFEIAEEAGIITQFKKKWTVGEFTGSKQEALAYLQSNPGVVTELEEKLK